jgi:hypothetical protein
MGVFQTSSAGNIGQPGAPGTVVVAPAALARAIAGSEATTVSRTVARIRRAARRGDRGVTLAVSTAPESDLSNGAMLGHNGRQNSVEGVRP